MLAVAVIWDALKAAIEQSDPATAFLILDSAGISYQNNDLHVCYDERGTPLIPVVSQSNAQVCYCAWKLGCMSLSCS